MQPNVIAVLICAIGSMIIGTIWHSKALFGPAYMKALGADMNMPPEKMKEIQKKMWQIFLAQFILVNFQVWILWFYVIGPIQIMSPVVSTVWIWAGFIMPTIAGATMWSARPRKDAWKVFLISAGYQLVNFIMFGLVIGMWI